ncbi:MAG: copper chaperone [Flavobacteriaceae bacterium TMED81]|nr:MAG: copper chaperone [Flavobacteriaceae bacterium TMED81]|tara:strand:+ start:83 stop:766 length:684 start_codon:yes stop_codon:yes gene_type:complete
MKQIIHIEGMTCQGCASSVEEAIAQLPAVESVSANPKTGVVAVLQQSPVRPDEIKAVLPPKYALVDHPSTAPSKAKQLFPLGLIFVFLIGGTTIMHFPIFETQAVLPDFMGLFFVVFSFFKFLDLKGFQDSFRRYDPLAKSLPFYGWVYPFVELALGVLFLMRLEVQLALWLTLGILSITTLGVVKVLLSKQQIQCACLGSVLNLPMTEATLTENTVMIGMAGWMLL